MVLQSLSMRTPCTLPQSLPKNSASTGYSSIVDLLGEIVYVTENKYSINPQLSVLPGVLTDLDLTGERHGRIEQICRDKASHPHDQMCKMWVDLDKLRHAGTVMGDDEIGGKKCILKCGGSHHLLVPVAMTSAAFVLLDLERFVGRPLLAWLPPQHPYVNQLTGMIEFADREISISNRVEQLDDTKHDDDFRLGFMRRAGRDRVVVAIQGLPSLRSWRYTDVNGQVVECPQLERNFYSGVVDRIEAKLKEIV